MILIIMFQFFLKSLVDPISVQLSLKDQCSNIIKPADYAYFKKGVMTYKADSEGRFALPSTGDYELYVMDYEYPITYNVSTSKVDTLNLPKLLYKYEPTSSSGYAGYYDCNKLATGTLIDCYKEGKKRIEGKFRNGKLINKLKKYDLNGKQIK